MLPEVMCYLAEEARQVSVTKYKNMRKSSTQHNWLQTDVGNKDVNNCFLRPGLAPVVGPVDGVQPDHHLQF